jgi:regulator of sigma E protease
MVITLVAFFVMLIVLVLVHEAGHFFTAKAMKVRVEEFGLFYPPRLWGFKKGNTTYSINAIPIGGFVKLAGEEDPKVPDSLAGKSVGARMLVLSSGALMNLILPLVLLSVAFMVPHTDVSAPILIDSVGPGSPAEYAGILPGDTILEVNNRQLSSPNELDRYIQLNLGNEINLLIQHADLTEETVQLVPRWKPPADQGVMGIRYNVDAIIAKQVVSTKSYPFWQAIPLGFNDCIQTFILFKNGIIKLIIGAEPATFLGPVGVAQLTGEIARAGVSPLLEFAAAFSINLGILNLFPLPALDGGRIFFVLLEWIRRGKRVSPKVENLVHFIGFMLLMGLVLFFTYNDIARIISGGTVLQ